MDQAVKQGGAAVAGERVVAFMDIGTNAVRLMLVRLRRDHGPVVLTNQKEVVRLGEGEFARRRLTVEAMDRAVLVCRNFAEMARSQGAAEIVAVATSASREARNQAVFLARLKDEARLEVRVVSGPEEARLIYLGVSSGEKLGEKQALFIDVGGGSTELAVGDQQRYYHLDSLKLGAIRLANEFIESGDTGKVDWDLYKAMLRHARDASVRVVQRLRRYRIDIAIGSSGTAAALAAIAANRLKKKPPHAEDQVTLTQIKQVARLLCGMTLAQRRRVPGLNPARADIIVPGAAILQVLMEELKLDNLRITGRSLRDGLLVEYLSGGGHGDLAHLTQRQRSVLHLGRACGFDEQHHHTVTHLALDLFDAAKAAKLHDLGQWERGLLESAAMLHDIGAFVSYTNHQAHSYYLIRNADLLGFDQAELAILAAIARYHRKPSPRRKHPEFGALDKRGRRVVRVCSVLLRMAESLDRSHNAVVKRVALIPVDQKTVELVVHGPADCQLEIWGVQTHAKAFFKALGRELIVRHEVD